MFEYVLQQLKPIKKDTNDIQTRQFADQDLYNKNKAFKSKHGIEKLQK